MERPATARPPAVRNVRRCMGEGRSFVCRPTMAYRASNRESRPPHIARLTTPNADVCFAIPPPTRSNHERTRRSGMARPNRGRARRPCRRGPRVHRHRAPRLFVLVARDRRGQHIRIWIARARASTDHRCASSTGATASAWQRRAGRMDVPAVSRRPPQARTRPRPFTLELSPLPSGMASSSRIIARAILPMCWATATS